MAFSQNNKEFFEERRKFIKESKEFLKAREECRKIMPDASEKTLDSCAQTVIFKKILDENLKRRMK